MASTLLLGLQSGGQPLVSGNIFSGAALAQIPIATLSIRLSSLASGIIFVGLPPLSGTLPTLNSGGNLASGGLADALELSPGQSLQISKARLVSGILTPMLIVPALQSGFRVYWEPDVTWNV